MRVELVHIGFGSAIAINRVLAITVPDSAPIKRLVQEARDQHNLVDLTHGRKTKAVMILDNGQLVLVAFQPETILKRLQQQRESEGERVVATASRHRTRR